jgi:hypothetical protein
MPSLALPDLPNDDVELHGVVDDEEEADEAVIGVYILPVVALWVGEDDVRDHQQDDEQDEQKLQPGGPGHRHF